jgi:hypothetical protein
MEKPQNVRPLWQFIAETVTAWHDCRAALDAGTLPAETRALRAQWLDIHADRLAQAGREFLPAGSGFDSGSIVNLDASRPGSIRLETEFHHMNAGGFYDGWTAHGVTLRPAFGFPALRVTGRDRDGIKDYIAETFRAALEARVGLVRDPAALGGARLVSVPEIEPETLAENAACLWEAVLDVDPFPAPREGDSPWVRALRARRARRADVGAAALRVEVAGLAEAVESAWKIASAHGYESPFDWEFCPAFIALCVDWEHGPTLDPRWREIARGLGEADGVETLCERCGSRATAGRDGETLCGDCAAEADSGALYSGEAV